MVTLPPKAGVITLVGLVAAMDVRALLIMFVSILLLLAWGVVLPAVWSSKLERRQAAQKLLQTIIASTRKTK